MSLKKKMVTAISMFAIVFSMLMVGVWAVSSDQVSFGGKITFVATNILAEISGEVDNTQSDPTLTTLKYTSTSKPLDTELATWNNNLVFKEDGSPFTIKITITNKSERLLFVTVTDTTTTNASISKSITKDSSAYTSGTKTSINAGSSSVYLITIGLTGTNESVTGNYGYQINLEDENNPVDVTSGYENLAFTYNDDLTASVKGNNASAKTIEIPAYITKDDKTYTVNEIALQAFKNYASLENISIPNTIQTIGAQAFAGCSKLVYTEIDGGKYLGNSTNSCLILAGVTDTTLSSFNSIQDNTKIIYEAFKGCANLTNVEIPDNIEIISYAAFAQCTNIETITLPNSITGIGYGAFMYSSKLANINIPTDLSYLGEYAFYECKALQSISIPEGITRIEGYTFAKCTNLTNITLPTTLTYIGKQAFRYSGLIEITLPNNVSSVGTSTFSDCTSLKTAILSKNLKEIPNHMFYMCTALENVQIQSDIINIGIAAFNECKVLTEIDIPDSVTGIGRYAFSDCFLLNSIKLPSSLEFIGNSAFNHCYAIQNAKITLPAGIKQIGGETYDPENPDTSVIGSHVFYNCATNTLREFEIDSSNPYYMTIDGVLYRKENGVPTVLVAYPADKRDATYDMPDTVVNAFELSLSRAFYLRKIILSDSFVIKPAEGSQFANAEWSNNLLDMIYLYSGVVEIECNSSNPNYISYNKQVYSKDGKTLYYSSIYTESTTDTTLKFDNGINGVGVTTLSFGSLACDSDRPNNVPSGNTNADEANHLSRFSKIIIPATVTSIDDATLSNINAQLWTIEVESGNTSYTVTGGKLAKIA